MARLLINAREAENRIVVEQEGQMQKVYIEQPEHLSFVGNIYFGIVEKVVPSMNAAFVHIGKGKKGFLHLSQIPGYILEDKDSKRQQSISQYIHQGEKIIVQVQKDETDHKYYRVTGNIELPGDILVYMPYGKYIAVSRKLDENSRMELKAIGKELIEGNEGLIFRTDALNFSKEELRKIMHEEREKWQQIEKQTKSIKAPAPLLEINHFLEEIHEFIHNEHIDEIVCDDIDIVQQLKVEMKNVIYHKERENILTHYLLQKDLETLHKKVVWLKNGSNIVIEENEAFTIIDINTAKFTGSGPKDVAIRATNTLAAKEIARQLRLRNIGGNIFIDFINMKQEKDRKEIISLLKREFEKDPERTTIYGFTSLGILEMSRKRTKPSLQQKMTVSCPVCQGTGNVFSPASIAFQLERELWEYKDGDYSEVIIEATEDVESYFTGENKEHVKRLEETLRFSITFKKIEFEKPHYHIKRILRY